MKPITDEERRRDAELETLARKITEEDPGFWDRVQIVFWQRPKLKGEALD